MQQHLLDAGHEVCGVFTRRDKPVGRKQILTAPPVKQLAVEHGLSVYQPRTLRDGSSDELIKELAPDIIVVVAYGCIIPPQLLHAAKYGCINLHVSLLPKYRGSAPIQWAVLNGDEGTGVTIMQLDEGLDTGDILMVEPVTIDPEETSGELFDRVSAVGAGLGYARDFVVAAFSDVPKLVQAVPSQIVPSVILVAAKAFAHRLMKRRPTVQPSSWRMCSST